MSEQPVLVTRHEDDGVAVITLDSPHNRNALSTALLTQLRDAVHEAAADESLVAILLVTAVGLAGRLVASAMGARPA